MSEKYKYRPNLFRGEEYPTHFVFTHRGRELNDGDVVGYTRDIESAYPDRKTPVQTLIWQDNQVIGVSGERKPYNSDSSD